MHENGMRPAGDIRMDGNREDELVVLAIEIVKVVSPDILDIAGIHEPMAVGSRLDEHHRRQVVNVPVGWDFHQTRVVAFNHGLHPFVGLLGVVDFGPAVPGAQVIGLAVFVAHAVVVFNAVVEQELCALFAGFPPTFIHLFFVLGGLPGWM